MNKKRAVLAIIFAGVLISPLVVGATEKAPEVKSEEEYYEKKGKELTYEFVGEEIVGNELMRTYRESGELIDVWSIIEIPEEIIKRTSEITDQEKRLTAVYEELTKLYTKEKAWYRLNVLTHQENEWYPVTNVKVIENQKKITRKNMETVRREIQRGNEPLIVSNKAMYTDANIVDEMYETIAFKSKEEADEVLSEKIKELKTENLSVKIGTILLILVIMGVTVARIRRKRGDEYDKKK